MKIHLKLAVAALLLAAMTALAGPAAATPTYPPSTPSATQTQVVPPSPSSSVLGVSVTRRVSDSLPRTGSELAVWGAVGALLVAGGAGVVVAARRRPTRSH